MSTIPLIEELTRGLPLERRSNSTPTYLEAVVEKRDLEALTLILSRHLGPAAKSPGAKVRFSPEVQTLVDSFGGLRPDQSFFCLEKDGELHYAALWPWQSDTSKITIKVGTAQKETVPAKKAGFFSILFGRR